MSSPTLSAENVRVFPVAMCLTLTVAPEIPLCSSRRIPESVDVHQQEIGPGNKAGFTILLGGLRHFHQAQIQKMAKNSLSFKNSESYVVMHRVEETLSPNHRR
jgi:hypothetical protein